MKAEARYVTRAEVAAMLRLWQDRGLGEAGVKRWIENANAAPCENGSDEKAVTEVLAELDLLEIYLLTRDDVPALLTLLASNDSDLPAALERWFLHRDAIDLDARSKTLKKDKFYRPFCR